MGVTYNVRRSCPVPPIVCGHRELGGGGGGGGVAGDANTTPPRPKASLTIGKATPVVTVTGGTSTYDGARTRRDRFGDRRRRRGLGPVTFHVQRIGRCAGQRRDLSVVASFAGDTNYNAGARSATLTIGKGAPAVSVTGGTFTFDGAAHAATGLVTGAGGAASWSADVQLQRIPDRPSQRGQLRCRGSFAGNDHSRPLGNRDHHDREGRARRTWGPIGHRLRHRRSAQRSSTRRPTPGTFRYSPSAGAVLPRGAAVR